VSVTVYLAQWKDRETLVRGGSLVAVALVTVALSTSVDRFVAASGLLSVDPAEGLALPAALVVGPVGIWGVALGHLLGDVAAGVAGPASVIAALGQLALGLVGYELWRRFGSTPAGVVSRRDAAAFVLVAVVGTAVASSVVGWGSVILGELPFFVVSVLQFPRWVLATLLVGFPVLVVWPRLMSYRPLTVTEGDATGPPESSKALLFVSLAWYVGGTGLSLGLYVLALVPDGTFQSLGVGWLPVVFDDPISSAVQITFGTLLFVWLLVSYRRTA
jgi:hypothetical protein